MIILIVMIIVLVIIVIAIIVIAVVTVIVVAIVTAQDFGSGLGASAAGRDSYVPRPVAAKTWAASPVPGKWQILIGGQHHGTKGCPMLHRLHKVPHEVGLGQPTEVPQHGILSVLR